MGKAKIISHLGHAQYKCQIIKDITRVDVAKKRCEKGISEALEVKAKVKRDVANARDDVAALGEKLDAAITAANGDSTDATVKALQKKQTNAADNLEAAQHALAQAGLKWLAYTKELETYADIAGTENRTLWCADDTETLAAGAEVGTIEINQETTDMLVAPGGKAPDSILQPGMANDPLAAFLNWAILPGVQRWKPTYRLGTIKDIDYDADTCTVCLDDARSSAQNIKINEAGTECEKVKPVDKGFLDFCERNPEHTACVEQEDKTITLTSEMMETLKKVNKEINEKYTYQYDSDQYDKMEHWEDMTGTTSSGDCEDYALTKMTALVAAGIPPGALKLATGVVGSVGREKGGHAWLEVQTDKGNIALDLNFQDPQESLTLPYSNRSVQSNGLNWVGKGLLIEDVPIEYMECNASAFKADDRIVVHFEGSDWDKPRVIGFESEPAACGNIICVYEREGVLKASKLYINGETIKKIDIDNIGEYGSFPMYSSAETCMRTFSKKFLINKKSYYLMATPDSEGGFIFNSMFDYNINRTGSQNQKYYYIYNPSNGKRYQIPVKSFGIFNRFSCFNISEDTFYTCRIEFTPEFVLTFSSVKFSVDPSGNIIFGDVVEDVLPRSYFYDRGYYVGDAEPSLAIDYVSPDGVFNLAYVNAMHLYTSTYTPDGYVICEGAVNYVLSYNVKTHELKEVVNNKNDSSVPYAVQQIPDISGDKILYHDATLSSTRPSISFDGSEIPWAYSSRGGGNPALITVNQFYAKRLKLPMAFSSGVPSKKCFYRYYIYTYYVYEGYPASAYGHHISVDKIGTPFESIDNDGKNCYGMSYIELNNDSVFQAIVKSDQINITDLICYYNGRRVDSQIAEIIGTEKTKIIGFVHRPRH